VKLLPLGGYISMAGMYPPAPQPVAATAASQARAGFFASMVQDARAANEETLDGVDRTGTFYALPVWRRIVIMLGGPDEPSAGDAPVRDRLQRHRRADRDDHHRRGEPVRAAAGSTQTACAAAIPSRRPRRPASSPVT
jgi:hypothetical protein